MSRTSKTPRSKGSSKSHRDRRRLLVAMRNLIAEKLDEGSISSRDLASLTKRLADMSAEIEAIDKASNGHDPAMQALDTEDERLDEHED